LSLHLFQLQLDKLQYSIESTAELLDVSKYTVKRDVKLGRIKSTRYFRRVLIPREEILRIASEGMRSETRIPVEKDAEPEQRANIGKRADSAVRRVAPPVRAANGEHPRTDEEEPTR